tara:strand:+ start:2743 stop:4449 length:1707 start_codon:yes stop_codon:yes gene_type:complete
MGDRPTITTLPAGGRYNVATLNSNFSTIRNKFDELIGRNGTGGSNNSASGNIDLNGNSLLNVGDVLNTSGAGFVSSVDYAEEWANKAEDSLVSAAAGGDQSDDYSSKHFSIKATAQVTLAAAQVTLATAQVTIATNYATKVNGAVTGSDFSSKAWAVGGTNVTTTGSRGAAKEWATTTGGAVDTSEYSSKEYAIGTTATSSKTYATKVDGAVTGSDFSSKAWAIGGTNVTTTGSRGAAKEWATSTGAAVDTSEYSAKEYAVGSTVAAGSSKEWALGGGGSFTEGTAITGSLYSARKYASDASTSATTAQAAALGWGAVTTITGSTTNLETTDARDYYIIDATSNPVTINLPAIGTTDGLIYGFQVHNVDNAISIVRDGTDRINGVAGNYSGLTAVGQVIHFISDEATPDNWLATIISQNATATATSEGVVELATDAETITGSVTNRALTPANLAATFPTIRQIPQNSKSAAYGIVLADAGKHIYHPGADTSARIWTLPANASIPIPIGSAITFVNDTSGGPITIAIASDVLVLAPDGTTGSRTLAANGIATCIKMTATRWMISGSGLT